VAQQLWDARLSKKGTRHVFCILGLVCPCVTFGNDHPTFPPHISQLLPDFGENW
jgi:hypothetical protein